MSRSAPSPPPLVRRPSSRTSSIRRKPVRYEDEELDDARSTRETRTMADVSGASRSELNLAGRDEPASSDGHGYGTSTQHRRTASASSRDPYSTAAPSAMTASAQPSLSRNASTSSHRPLNGNAAYPPSSIQTEEVVPLSHSPPLAPHSSSASAAFQTALNSRPSLHSQRSSIAPESVYGTAPVGTIGKTKPREVIRIERDYSAGETCQFWSGWIWELEGRVSPTDFQNTLNELNTVLASAHDPYKSIMDNCIAVLTLYLSPYVLSSHYEREMRKFERILERANREVYNPVGLNFLSPRKNAYLFLEVEYY
ncbi:hypothetical protein JCM10207_004467 [Rhodosporidiobolus poonsookiae]